MNEPVRRGRPSSVERSVADRWTPALAKGGWTPVVDVFLDFYHRRGITPAQAMFIIHLMRYKWEKDPPYPRLAMIARQMGVTAATVRGHVRLLEGMGVLRRQYQDGKPTKYDLSPLFGQLETFAAQKKPMRRSAYDEDEEQ